MTPNELDLRQTLQEDASRIDAPGDFAAAAIGLDHRRSRRRTTLTAAAAAIAAVVVAALGPVVFGLTLQAMIVAGLAAAAS